MIQLVVTYFDHEIGYFTVPPNQGWKIDAPSRCLIVGRGIPRTYIPLDKVRSFEIDRYGEDE